MSPEVLAQRLALLQQWMGREISARQVQLHPSEPLPAPRLIADATVVIDPANDKPYPSQNSNHVEHLGTSGLASKRILLEICDLFRSAGVVRFFVYLSPSDQSSDIDKWLRAEGFEETVELAVLWREATVVPRVSCPFDIRLCEASDADLLTTVVASDGDPFSNLKSTVDMLGEPSFYTYLGLCGDVPVATGSLYVHQDLGYLGNGKTLDPFRKRGAQSSIIAERINLAARLGCTDVVSETYSFLKSSYDNLLRAGFAELYARKIFRWEK